MQAIHNVFIGVSPAEDILPLQLDVIEEIVEGDGLGARGFMLSGERENILKSNCHLGGSDDDGPDKGVLFPHHLRCNAGAGCNCLERTKPRYPPALLVSVETDVRSIRLEVNHFISVQPLLTMRIRGLFGHPALRPLRT